MFKCNGFSLTLAELDEAREWLLELDGSQFRMDDQAEYVEMIQGLSARGIYNSIARHYDGGWATFLAVIA